MENCTGTVEAEYPLYSYGKTTVTGSGKLTLRSSNIAVVAKQYSNTLGGQVIFDNANVEIHSTGKGIQAENLGKVTVKNGGNVQVNAATNGLRVFENGTFTLESGTVTLTGTGAENSYGLYANGTAEIKGGTLNTGNVYAAILNAKTRTVSFTGGTHNLKGMRIGYIDNAAGQLTIGGSANVTFEAPVGIQVSEKKGGKLNLTGSELFINCTTTGLNSLSGAGKTTLSGGELRITDKNESPSAVSIYARGEMEVCGAELSFTGCKTDIQSINGANKLSSGKIKLSGASYGMQIYLGFLMTGGQIESQCATAGIMVLQGTATLKAGKLDLHGGIPLYLYYGGTLDFAGAEVSATTNAQCALYVDPDTENGVNSYKITGGTVELKSGKAAASTLYTAIPENYGLWAGKDAESVKYIANPAQEILLTNSYARFGKVETYTLTLVNVKEGTSASHNGGEALSYTAKDAPADQHFSHWELTLAGDTTKVGTDPVYSGTMPFGNATLTAVYENCTGGTATCTTRAICQICGKAYGGLGSHSYTAETPEETYLKSETTCTEAAVYYKSCAGYGASSRGTESEAAFTYGSPLEHDWESGLPNHDGTHTHICSRNPEHKGTKDCQGGTADCTHGPICELCGEEYGQPGSHSYTAETPEETYLKSEATCTEAAVYYKSCVGCGESSRGMEHEAVFSHGNPLGHDEVTDAKVDPTCTTTGLTEGKHCRRCGETLTEQREIPVLGHEIPNGTVTKEPTCLEEGEKVGTCVRCGEANGVALIAQIKQDPQFRQMQILAYGQKPNVPDYDVPFGYELSWYAEVNCTTPFDFNQPLYQNKTIYGKLEQIIYPITYVLNGGQNAESNPAEYVMGVGTVLADPHRENYLFEGWFTDAAFSSPITAISPQTTGAYTLYAKWALDPNHPYQFGPCLLGADGKHDRFCSICERAIDCEYTDVVTEPTCTSAGYTTHTCTACGLSYVDTIVEGGHIWNQAVTNPTHTEMGYTTYTCLCGETRTQAISMIGHDYEKTVTVPTCTKMGFTTYVCKNCGHTYKDSYLAAAGHKWDEGKVTSAPTITDTGRLVQTCVLCGKTKESTIPMLTACDGGSGCPAAAYTDVPGVAHWANVGIDFVLKSGLFYGTSDREFHPNGEMTRAMLVTVLYRLEGKTEVSAASPFADVENGLWYSNAVIWAAENQIVNGIGNGQFNPEGKITREQMATILYRYSEYKGLTLGEGTFAGEYTDLEEISAYARKAMAWANAEGLINGVEESGTVTLQPQGNATRAQVAVILMRYVENILNTNK